MNPSVKYWLREVGIILFASLAIFFLLQMAFIKAEVIGESMEPNLYKGQQIMINKMAYKFSEPDRGDIIIFTPPSQTGATSDYIKRIIGMPGEKVSVIDGMVHITKPNGQSFTLDEPYTAELAMFDYQGGVIPDDHYFVMGDNRNNSSDSRGGWTVPLENITGKAWFTYWPFSEFGGAPHYSLPE
ncbi:MAG: signal peptidase I [Dehalococcoidales bacterium]|nr:signal peptidase I [Dehalococcoidales bacterium]